MKKQRDSGRNKKNLTKGINMSRFVLLYVSLMGLFFILIGLKPVQDIIDINGLYTEGVVVLTSKVLGFTDITSTHRGSIIELPSIALDVRFGCNGLEAVMLYAVAVIAFPASWKKRITGITGGFMVIQLINILRIAGLAYTGVYFKDLFEYIHICVVRG